MEASSMPGSRPPAEPPAVGTESEEAAGSRGGPATAGPDPPEFVLLGATGFLGSAILRSLEAAGHRVVTSRVRLQDRLGIERLLDEARPSLGLICAAGERGRPNISWCESHPVETVDANITGQLNVAAACHARRIHVTLLGTGALYVAAGAGAEAPAHRFREEDPPNSTKSVYNALRHKMEELLSYFDNALVLRVLYPLSGDLDPRGLVGKLARFERVDPVASSITVLDDLLPLMPVLVSRRATGVLNFVNRGVVAYADVVAALDRHAPASWKRPRLEASGEPRPACELDVARLEAAVGRAVPEATASLHRIVTSFSEEDWAPLLAQRRSPL